MIQQHQQQQSPSQTHHPKQQNHGKNIHANQQLLLLLPNKANVTSMSTANHNSATVVHTKIVSVMSFLFQCIFQ